MESERKSEKRIKKEKWLAYVLRLKSWERERPVRSYSFVNCELCEVHLNRIDKLVLNVFLLIRNFNAIIQTVLSNSLSRVW